MNKDKIKAILESSSILVIGTVGDGKISLLQEVFPKSQVIKATRSRPMPLKDLEDQTVIFDLTSKQFDTSDLLAIRNFMNQTNAILVIDESSLWDFPNSVTVRCTTFTTKNLSEYK